MRAPLRIAALLLAAAAGGCSSTLVDQNGADLVPSGCACTAPPDASPVCNPDGSCDFVCSAGLLKCGGGCLACTPPANATAVCAAGACGFACNAPTRLCPAAPGGTGSCQLESELSCGPSCAACPGPSAGPGRAVCQPGASAGQGTCSIACDAGTHACGGACEADTDPLHCGASCQVCTAPPNASPLCEGGACAFACDPGWMRCGSGCCRASTVAAGGEFGCAVLTDGRARCWGANDRGQLGDGGTASSAEPVDVTGLPAGSRVTALALGWAHACAVVDPGGLVYCWGDNGTRQLGPGTTAPSSPVPVLVTGISGVAAPASASAPPAIVAGGGVTGSPPAPFGHTCAVGAGGLACWGANASGQLGDGSTVTSAAPRPVTGLATAAALAAGGSHTCAATGGVLRCWGEGASGQLGDGGTASRTTPSPVVTTAFPPGGTAVAVAAGRSSTCAAVGSPPALFCWGDNAEGQVTASAPPPASSATPLATALGGGFNPSWVTAGRAHACGLEPGTAAMKCFGANAQSQLSGAATPVGKVDVALTGAVPGASVMAAGGDHTCALLTDGSVQCWGANGQGQTGTGRIAGTVVTPTYVSGR